MSLSSEKVGTTLVVTARGQINSAYAGEIEIALLEWVSQGDHEYILDLSGLDYISSAGLRVILLLAKRLKQQSGQLLLCGMQPQVREVFDISGFLAILSVVDDRNTALEQ